MRITLKSARVNANLTQKQLADVLNVSTKTIISWENGFTMPKIDKVEALCNALKVSYDDIQWQI